MLSFNYEGFNLTDVKKCVVLIIKDSYVTDVNECAVHNGGCAHICENLDGSFKCSCREGFKLHLNGKDCIGKN